MDRPFLQIRCKSNYKPDDEWLPRKFLPGISWIDSILRFLGKHFGQEYDYHVKVAKTLKEKNDNIYKTVMVSYMYTQELWFHVLQIDISNWGKTSMNCRLQSCAQFGEL